MEHQCVVCGKVDIFNDVAMQGEKYLCPKCFQEVRKEFEKRNPGQSLMAKEDPEQ